MKENKGFAIACGLLVSSLLFVAYNAEHSNSFFGLILCLASISCWLGLFLLAIYRVLKRSFLPWEKRLAPVYLVCMPFVVLLAWSSCEELINSGQEWLSVESYDFTGSDNLLFRKDGEYKYWRNSPLGSSAKVYGRYERRDSLLILQLDSEKALPPIARLVIRPYAQFGTQREKSSTRLFVLDSAGNSQGSFHITQHNY
ncbi:MAG: hypothetical protein ACRYFX_22860 [Janthinobacterium lividum]